MVDVNESEEVWQSRDWSNMPVETAEFIGSEVLNQVKGMLDNPERIFTREEGKRLVSRLELAVWVCHRTHWDILARQLNTVAHEIAKRANVPPPTV